MECDKIFFMLLRPCPICRKPVNIERAPSSPFCSERCRVRDLAAWSTEDYRIAQKPEEESGENWGEVEI